MWSSNMSRSQTDCSFANSCMSSSIDGLETRVSRELYVRGFLNAGGYEAIPARVSAYSPEDHFRYEPQRGSSVQQEDARWTAEGKL